MLGRSDERPLGRVQREDMEAIERAAVNHGYKDVRVEFVGWYLNDFYYRLYASDIYGGWLGGTATYLISYAIADGRRQ